MNYGFFLFRFTSASDRDEVLNDGPYVVDDATLALEPWSPTFVPSSDRLPRTVLWMRLPDLPTVLECPGRLDSSSLRLSIHEDG